MSLHNFGLWLLSLDPRRYTATKCGHRTKRVGRATVFDDRPIFSMPLNDLGSVDYCLDCIGDMSIRCAWCEKIITVGSPVTLYSPKDKDFKIPDHAVVYKKKDPLQLVGCLGWNCAHTGGDRAGFWMPGNDGKGVVERVPTAWEAVMASGGNSVMIISDLNDRQEAMDPTMIPLSDSD